MNKYILTENYKTLPNGTKVYQIKALRDIPRIGVKAGDLGGYIESERNLSQQGNAFISGNAQVSHQMVIKSPIDLINISGIRFTASISLTGINVGCRHYSDFNDFLNKYKEDGKASGYTDIELKYLKVSIKNALKLIKELTKETK
jgi:hypothetical protein